MNPNMQECNKAEIDHVAKRQAGLDGRKPRDLTHRCDRKAPSPALSYSNVNRQCQVEPECRRRTRFEIEYAGL
jgi:hypothetical protein